MRRATTDTLARGVSSTIRTLSSCHRSVQHTGRADLVTAQAGDEGRGLAVAPGCLADQPRALAAAAPCPNHFSVGSGFIDEDQLSCIKTGLLGFPLQARFGDVGRSCSAARSVFLKLIPCRSKNLRIDLSVVTNTRPAWSRCSSSCSVRPRRLGLTLPVSSCSSDQRTADDASPGKVAPLAAVRYRPPLRPQRGCEDRSNRPLVPSVPPNQMLQLIHTQGNRRLITIDST